MRVIGTLILVASWTWSAAAQDRPLSPEETQIIEKARELALDYTAKLPNFICTETIRRSQLPRRSKTWKLLDTIAVDVAFSDQGERYKPLTINGKPTTKSFKELGGARSDAEFGSLLQWIFQPESQTKFEAERPTDLRGQPTLVFSYRIEQDHSKFEIGSSKRSFNVITPVHMIAAFGGLLYLDRGTKRVLKITAAAFGIPADWALTAFSQEVDYGVAEISGQQVFLPLNAQMNVSIQDGSQNRNDMEFGNYRKFSSEATLQFEPQ
jgi:hypothetical protein